jgi:hypothetical protein
MMDTQTYIVKSKKTIYASEQNVCDVCKEPATCGATDAVETESGWTQTPMRYGCNNHLVIPNVEYLKK